MLIDWTCCSMNYCVIEAISLWLCWGLMEAEVILMGAFKLIGLNAPKFKFYFLNRVTKNMELYFYHVLIF